MATRHRNHLTVASAIGTLALLAAPVEAQVGGPEAVVTAGTPSADARFGWAVDAKGPRAVVGAIGHGPVGARVGAAHLLELENGTWVPRALLLASDGGNGDELGYAVALDGDRALVGAHGWDAPGAPDAGAAYVFERQGDGAWTEVARLVPTAPFAFAHFGWSVDLAGDRALVGAVSDSGAGAFAGAAHVFERQEDGTWLEVGKLTDPEAQFGDSLGHTVALAGDEALVGALLDDDAGNGAGAVHVFRRGNGGGWSHVQRLTAGAAGVNARFGQSLSADGDWAVVGTWIEDASGAQPGRAHLFERDASGLWLERQTITGKPASPYFGFGIAADLEDDLLVVGSRRVAFGSAGPGLVRAYRRDASGTWNWLADVSPQQQDTFDRFGAAVAVVDGDEFLGGAWSANVGASTNAGAVYAVRVGALMRSSPTVSIQSPQPVDLALFAGPEHAGSIYAVIGSVTGVGPTAFDGVDLPLDFDAYTEYTLVEFGVGILRTNIGLLDDQGSAGARFLLPSNLAPSFAGLTVWHAAVVLDPQVFWPPVVVTEPIDLRLVP
jgi:hypothetical protein